jgi:RimJ/RimL family protein N-acetyltransferase
VAASSDHAGVVTAPLACTAPASAQEESWRQRQPELSDGTVTLRELRPTDAPTLLANISTPEVLRYLTQSPSSVGDFLRFIRWSTRCRRQGRYVCFGIVPAGMSHAVGVIQIWAVEPDFSTAEWGFVLGQAYWGTGLFLASARLLLDFAFDTLHVARLEARAVELNGRGSGALRKLGATPEGILREAFKRADVTMSHVMWSILAEEWSDRRQPTGHEQAGL